MVDQNKSEVLLAWRSAYRGYIILGIPYPFLCICAGYLTYGWRIITWLIAGSCLLIHLLILHQRHGRLVQAMKRTGFLSPWPGKRRWTFRIVASILGVLLFGFIINPMIPLFAKGLLASAYYLFVTIVQYQKVREPQKECE